MALLELTIEQKRVRDDLVGRIEARIAEIVTLGHPGGEDGWPESNAFGILGPRGMGKSTLLKRVCRRLAERPNCLVLPPIDCTAIDPHLTPSAVALLQVARHLECSHPGAALSKRIVELASAGSRMDDEYRKLCAEISSVPDDYPHFMIESARARLDFQRSVRAWLDDLWRQHHIEVIVLPFDDFDLAGGEWVRRWVRAQLDELHQLRLVPLLCADLSRLGHLTFSKEFDLDDLTGQALLDKALPPDQRVVIGSWSWDDATTFPPGQPVDTLKSRVDAQGPELAAHIARLHPRRPRGLRTFYGAISGKMDFRDCLEALAASRGEAILARRIRETPPSAWSATLKWSERPDDDERFIRSVAAARTGVALAILDPDRPGPTASDSLRHDPRWGDPLRHDEFRTDPLGDAEASSRAGWVEALLDMELRTDPLTRLELLRHVHVLRERTVGCQFAADVDSRSAREVFRHVRDTHALVSWVRVSSNDDGLTYRVGWSALVDSFRRGGAPWPSELLHRIGVGPNLLGRSALSPSKKLAAADSNGVVEAGAYLPASTRALVLVAAAMTAQPWARFDLLPMAWRLSTALRLAAAFVADGWQLAAFWAGETKEAPGSRLDRWDGTRSGLRGIVQLPPPPAKTEGPILTAWAALRASPFFEVIEDLSALDDDSDD